MQKRNGFHPRFSFSSSENPRFLSFFTLQILYFPIAPDIPRIHYFSVSRPRIQNLPIYETPKFFTLSMSQIFQITHRDSENQLLIGFSSENSKLSNLRDPRFSIFSKKTPNFLPFQGPKFSKLLPEILKINYFPVSFPKIQEFPIYRIQNFQFFF